MQLSDRLYGLSYLDRLMSDANFEVPGSYFSSQMQLRINLYALHCFMTSLKIHYMRPVLTPSIGSTLLYHIVISFHLCSPIMSLLHTPVPQRVDCLLQHFVKLGKCLLIVKWTLKSLSLHKTCLSRCG